jgi:putative ABC transport system substrate-binding protein
MSLPRGLEPVVWAVHGEAGMRRREFIRLLAAAGTISPLAAVAQPRKPVTLGILVARNPDPAQLVEAIKAGLREFGYFEGSHILFEVRTGGANVADLAPLAAELVARKVDILFAYPTPAATALKLATTEIPIVVLSADPVGTGLVQSLVRPGGNITGVSTAVSELGAKNLELLHEAMPAARRVAVLTNLNDPFNKSFLAEIEAAASALQIELMPFPLHGGEGLDDAFAQLQKAGAEALVLQPSLPSQRVAELALAQRLPSFAPNAGFTALGGLMSYSADLDAAYRDVVVLIDKILKGRTPADLPVQLPTKFRLNVNLKTARVLGLTLPPTLLARADEVIE